jgi:phage head maturation protease
MKQVQLQPQHRYVRIDATEQKDDALWVFGYLITESVDTYGTVLTLEGAREALKEYEKYRNVRAMHEPDAVGKAWSLELDDKGLYIGVKVIDKEAIRKVEEGVYRT